MNMQHSEKQADSIHCMKASSVLRERCQFISAWYEVVSVLT